MTISPRRRLGAALFVALSAVLSTVAPAHGQPARSTERASAKGSEVSVRKTSDPTGASYEHTFDDDPLDANPNITRSLHISGRRRTPRVTLIRPRMQFVPELLKSVEAL
jgi:hypothetical protein